MSNKEVQPLRVGPSQHSEGGIVLFERYAQGGGIAIQVFGDLGPEYTATVNIPGQDPGEFGVWLKDWTPNEGVPEALVKAGIVELTGMACQTGFTLAKHAVLTDKARAALQTAA